MLVYGKCTDTCEIFYFSAVSVPKRFAANSFQRNSNAREEDAESTRITFCHKRSHQRMLCLGFLLSHDAVSFICFLFIYLFSFVCSSFSFWPGGGWTWNWMNIVCFVLVKSRIRRSEVRELDVGMKSNCTKNQYACWPFIMHAWARGKEFWPYLCLFECV